MPINLHRKKPLSPAEFFRRNLTFLHKAKPVPPYSRLAPVYDYLMRHVDYERWALYVTRLFERAGSSVHSVLDIACGTGSLALQLHVSGFRLFGFDHSHEMVTRARQKAEGFRLSVPFWQGDMHAFALSAPVDAIVCTYDSINYCLSLDIFSQVFESVQHALRPGGVFVFDLCSERNSRRNFRNYRESDVYEGWRYMRHSYYVRRDRLQINEFVIRDVESGEWFCETHKQRIYRLGDVRNIVPPDLTVLGVFGDFSFRPGSEKSDRVHFLLRKDGSTD